MSPFDDELLAPGVRGHIFRTETGIYIPMIFAERPGSGDVGRYLDSLPRDERIVVPTVVSARLQGMLKRRGFLPATEYVPEMKETMDIYERLPRESG